MHMLNLYRCDHNTIIWWINRSLSRIFYTSINSTQIFFNTNDASRPLSLLMSNIFTLLKAGFYFCSNTAHLITHCQSSVHRHNCCETRETQLSEKPEAHQISDYIIHHALISCRLTACFRFGDLRDWDYQKHINPERSVLNTCTK